MINSNFLRLTCAYDTKKILDTLSLFETLSLWQSRGFITKQVEVSLSGKTLKDKLSLLGKNAVKRILTKKYPDNNIRVTGGRGQINIEADLFTLEAGNAVSAIKDFFCLNYSQNNRMYPLSIIKSILNINLSSAYHSSGSFPVTCHYTNNGIMVTEDFIDSSISKIDSLLLKNEDGKIEFQVYYDKYLQPNISLNNYNEISILASSLKEWSDSRNYPLGSLSNTLNIIRLSIPSLMALGSNSRKSLDIDSTFLSYICMLAVSSRVRRSLFESTIPTIEAIRTSYTIPDSGVYMHHSFESIQNILYSYKRWISFKNGTDLNDIDNYIFVRDYINFQESLYSFIKSECICNNIEFLFSDDIVDTYISGITNGDNNE